MRLFENLEVYPRYLRDLHSVIHTSHAAAMQSLIDQRYFAVHLLQPVLDGDPQAMLAVGSDRISQRLWARDHGMPKKATRDEILLAQIEDHRTEIFYNIDPTRFPSDFIRRLPGCVRHSVAWRAAPNKGADLSRYDVVISNFPSIRASYEELGWRTAEFYPAIDPAMATYSRAFADRETDILFVGTYSRHHVERARALLAICRMRDQRNVRVRLVESRFTKLANSPLGLIGPLTKHRYPMEVRQASEGPVFGRDLYRELGNAKLVFNGAIDMAGSDRGNMRCFETMGCGAALFTDEGNYPPGMEAGRTIFQYAELATIESTLHGLFEQPERIAEVAQRGQEAVNKHYSKEKNWENFKALVAAL